MTRTTQIEYHPNRPVIHFGSPEGSRFWTEYNNPPAKAKKKRKKGKK